MNPMNDFPADLLRDFAPDARFVRLDAASSTNDAARDDAFRHGDLILAERQEAGRGQRGAAWRSDPGKNLTFSLVLEPRFLPADRQFLLSEAVSLAVADTLEQTGIPARIKWPNDILIENEKTAGTLIENDLRGMELARSIVGIGLNVNQTVFPPDVPNATSMARFAGAEFDRAALLGRLCGVIAARYRQLERGDTEALQADYLRRLWRFGRPAPFRSEADGRFTGTIRGVAPSGELRIAHPGGTVKSYLFKEIEFLL